MLTAQENQLGSSEAPGTLAQKSETTISGQGTLASGVSKSTQVISECSQDWESQPQRKKFQEVGAKDIYKA